MEEGFGFAREEGRASPLLWAEGEKVRSNLEKIMDWLRWSHGVRTRDQRVRDLRGWGLP